MTGIIPHLFHGVTEGKIHVAGKDTRETSVGELSTQATLLMQRPERQLSGARFTVREELAFSLENRGVPSEEMRQRVEAVLHKTGLSHLADCSPHRLSGGQLQQVVMAVALVADTPILVLDEPTTFLDPLSVRRCFETLKQLSREGKTIVLAEQRFEYIALYADRVIALHKGVIALDGPPAEVLSSPLLPEIGLDWTRFTKVADLARKQGLWRTGRPLSTTHAATCSGLRQE